MTRSWIFAKVAGNLEPIPGSIGRNGGVHPASPSQGTITYTHPFIHYGQFTNLPINLPCMSLDYGRKPEYPEETPAARGKHANSAHTHGPSGNRTQDPGGVNH
ncbi:hypothetical protein AMELA_G00095540 [Ameiurus melas]|uniref:Uncharacterized protein n=1 Tax=Ameiurus melas TaxID=219545 RepID=A0A7J6AX62_AMEME|nr:hypothetical protein AMELA_G00095540 [Ameiurus melas]